MNKLEATDSTDDDKNEDDSSSVSTDDFQTNMGDKDKNVNSGRVSVVASAMVGNGFAVTTNSGMTYLYEAEDTKGAENYRHLK